VALNFRSVCFCLGRLLISEVTSTSRHKQTVKLVCTSKDPNYYCGGRPNWRRGKMRRSEVGGRVPDWSDDPTSVNGDMCVLLGYKCVKVNIE
jgi:hypothetical protein